MSVEKSSTEIIEYSQRQKDWRDISSNQLSLANNILLTIASGYLVLIFDKKELSKVEINFNSNIDWQILFYFSSVLLTVIAIILGILILINRLYDFRISRHIVLTRKRVYKKHGEKLPESSLGSISIKDIICEEWSILFKKIDFITIDDVKDFKDKKDLFNKRFNRLRRQSLVIGSTPHKWTKFQIFLLLSSLVSYMTYIIKN